MPILSPVESRGIKGRLIHLSIILALTLGSLTMVYPFVVMVSGSFRSEMDQTQLDLVPSFWRSDETLYSKFTETKYNQNIAALNQSRNAQAFDFQRTPPPANYNEADAALLEEWMANGGVPTHWQVLGGAYGIKTVPENLRRLRGLLEERFDGDLNAFSRAAGAPIESWSIITLSPPEWANRRFDLVQNPVIEAYSELMATRPAAERQLIALSGIFLERMVYPVYGQASVERYNQAHPESPLSSFDDFRLSETVPPESQPQLRKDWIEFVNEELNPSFILVRQERLAHYRESIATAYSNDIDSLNRVWGTAHTSFANVTLPTGEWLSGQRRQDYETYLHSLDPEDLILVGPEFSWANYLDAQGIAYGDTRPLPPVVDLEWKYVQENRGSLRWSYSVRNYVNVWDELVFQGNALRNTAIFVACSIFWALLINPMAAYALSRYNLPGTYKILLFLMATMAFPPMVAMIPQFVLLQKMDLFNTFTALVIPMVVDGYMIFLLKGFFDSLPRELYEAARIDGAGEVRMFFGITMALSKPILAVLALGTFTAAYTSFLYPMLVAPRRDMWLMSVWLYQFQQQNNTAAVFASVVVCSVPTLVVFLFVQRTIMRGIVVPTEK